MDLARLRVFQAVADHGSFSRAARALFLSQPAVTQHIRALETELGVPLFDRLGRGTPGRRRIQSHPAPRRERDAGDLLAAAPAGRLAAALAGYGAAADRRRQ